jgi:DNA-directed RNA polymerase subunit RPC12/RpoP
MNVLKYKLFKYLNVLEGKTNSMCPFLSCSLCRERIMIKNRKDVNKVLKQN